MGMGYEGRDLFRSCISVYFFDETRGCLTVINVNEGRRRDYYTHVRSLRQDFPFPAHHLHLVWDFGGVCTKGKVSSRKTTEIGFSSSFPKVINFVRMDPD